MLPLLKGRKLPDGALRPLKIDSGGMEIDPETMKFFGTRLPKYAYEGPRACQVS